MHIRRSRKKKLESEKWRERGIVSKGNKQGIEEERKEKKIPQSAIDIVCQGTGRMACFMPCCPHSLPLP
jgi:hypothetical protein